MKINKEEDHNSGRLELEKLSALLEKYLNERCTEEEQHAIEAWYEALSGAREAKVFEELAAKQRIWTGIRAIRALQEERPAKRLIPQGRAWLKWAASIAVLCLSSVFAYVYLEREQASALADVSESTWTVEDNRTTKAMLLVLPDNSRITLKPGAVIGYPKTFNETDRIVKLEGEAFFEVRKDVTRPFRVVTGDITTRVLGTSFNVKAIDGQSVIEVDLRTGKVSVYEHDDKEAGSTEGVVLTPNEKVTYYKNASKWVAELVSNPLPLAANPVEPSALVFRDEPMRNVLERIASIYGIEIIVVNDAIYECPFTGDISHMELYDMLKLICKSIRADYEVRGTRILIEGEGCF